MKKIIAIAAVVGVGLGVMGSKLLGGEQSSAQDTSSTNKSHVSGLAEDLVKTESITQQEVQEVVAMTGKLSIDSLRLQQLSARVPGRVDRLAMIEGQAVKVGQPIAWIYSPEFISAQNEFLLAKRTAKTLNTDATQDLYEDAKATLEGARNKLRILGVIPADIVALEGRGAASEYLTVVSAINGVVTKRNVDVGGYLNTGDSLGAVADLSSLWFLGNVFESDLPKLKIGQTVDIQVLGLEREQRQGKISFISPTFDPQTHAVSIRVDLPNAKGELKPYMFAKAQVTVGLKKLPVVPRMAVVQDGAQSFVIVKESTGNYRRIPVNVVPGNDNDHLAITTEIGSADQVVVEGGVLVDRSLVNAPKAVGAASTSAGKL